jgi:hypothetical protein
MIEEMLGFFSSFWNLFYDVTMQLSDSLYVTSNMYFQEICGIQAHLQAFSESDDYVLSAMAEKNEGGVQQVLWRSW